MINASNILPSVGQTFHDAFSQKDRNGFLDLTQEEAQGLIPRPYKPSFKVLNNGVDSGGKLNEMGISAAPRPKVPGSIPATIPDTTKPADDLLTELTDTSDSVQADLMQISTSSMITMSRRNFFIIVALIIFVVIFLVAIFNNK